MKLFFASLPALLFLTNGYAQPVQLAPPLLKYESVFFSGTKKVEMLFAEKNTAIHYTLNNQTPTDKSAVYKQPLQIKGAITTVKAITTGKGFLSSAAVSVTFIKDGIPFKVVSQTAPAEPYKANGVATLNDNKGGYTDLHGGTWLGYQTDSVEVELQLDRKQTLSSVLLHCLHDNGSWVFLPESINVFYLDDKTGLYKKLVNWNQTSGTSVDGASCVPIKLFFNQKIKTSKLKILIKGVQSIPDDHPGKGQKGWLFIDEIKLY